MVHPLPTHQLPTPLTINPCLCSLNHLTGTLPPQYGPAWRNMELLLIGANDLEGPLPDEWGALGNAKKISIE